MAFKSTLAALALASAVYAQQCSNSNAITISSQSDVSQFQGCSPYEGDIIVDPNYPGAILQLDGFTGIKGDLTINGARNITQLSADRLTTIEGKFTLTGLTALTSLQMDFLSKADQITWTALPLLNTLNFATGIRNATNVEISNTGLRDLAGIELETVATMDINNNNQLNTINVNNLGNVTSSLTLSANGNRLNLMLPNLLQSGNMSIRGVASIGVPSLNRVRGFMGLYVDSFQNVSAPNLTIVDRSLAFVGCNQLVEIDMPELTIIGGGFLLANNTMLVNVTGLPKLQKIGGAIDFAGNFQEISFPQLNLVRGTTNIQTTSNSTTVCQEFTGSNVNKDTFNGKVNCRPGIANPQTNGTSNLDTGSDTKTGAAASFVASSLTIATTAFGVVAALFLL